MLSVDAQLLYALTHDEGHGPSRTQVGVAGIALAFSLWMAGATDADTVHKGTVMLLLGIPAYVLVRARRSGVGPGLEPGGGL